MKYYSELLKMKYFSKRQIEELVGNEKTAKSLLLSYSKKGIIKSIRRDYYFAVNLETGEPDADRFIIGSNINPSGYLSHHSAFEYYGMANQIFSEIYVSSTKRFNDFEFDGVNYKWVKAGIEFGIVKSSQNIKVTDIERTIVDSIKDFSKIGGIEELLRCIDIVPLIDEKKMLEYLSKYENQSLYQKTGYLLSHFKKNLKLSDYFFDSCQNRINKSVRYLYKGIEYEHPVYNSKWKLYVPQNLLKIIDEGGNAIV